MTKVLKSRNDELLDHMATCIADYLSGKKGMDAQSASELALDLVDELGWHFGGSTLYFKRGVIIDSDRQGEEILSKFEAGASVTELVLAYKLSAQCIYRKLKKARDSRRMERDKKLGKL